MEVLSDSLATLKRPYRGNGGEIEEQQTMHAEGKHTEKERHFTRERRS